MLVEHHEKYKEIHGVDETVWMEFGDHVKLHNKLRREGKCKIPPKELNKISIKAYQRTKKYRVAKKLRDRKRPPRHIGSLSDFIEFSETIGTNLLLRERIIYFKDKIYVVSRFLGNHGIKLPTRTI